LDIKRQDTFQDPYFLDKEEKKLVLRLPVKEFVVPLPRFS
jgi:hypothetical protein